MAHDEPDPPHVHLDGMAGGSLADDGWSQEPAALVEHGYSMIWPARSSSDDGIVRPRVFAVLRLMTRSNLLGCSIGRSAGFAPLRILSTKLAARRSMSRGLEL